MDRQDVGSWVSGPRSAAAASGVQMPYRGERLGLPEDGPGSVAPGGRRFVALFIDWISCAIVATTIFRYTYGSDGSAWATLLTFFAVKTLFTIMGGASFGQRIVGIKVQSLTQPWVNPGRSTLRTFLICIVIPAAIWDQDNRTLADRAAGTVDVRTR